MMSSNVLVEEFVDPSVDELEILYTRIACACLEGGVTDGLTNVVRIGDYIVAVTFLPRAMQTETVEVNDAVAAILPL